MNRSALYKMILLTLVIGSALILSGCDQREESKDLDFRFAMPASWQVVRVLRLDTNEDGDNEWVILYSFDEPGKRDFVPIRCAVYHLFRRDPKLPVIYPYHLQAPGWTYLGEGESRTAVKMGDFITKVALDDTYPPETRFAKNELLIQSTDGDGFVNRVSIFQWRDSSTKEFQDPNEILILPHEPKGRGQWYQCLGLFEGSLKVEVETDQVKVWERTNDRSQFAMVNTYKPTGGPGGYLDENDQTVPPVSSCIDFAFGVPQDVAQSPYPEKVVMAFLKEFTVKPDYGSRFLTDAARQRRKGKGAWHEFANHSQQVCVKVVSYGPGNETRADMQAFSQGHGVIATTVQTLSEHRIQGKAPRQVNVEWRLIKEDNTWKIDDVRYLNK